MPRLEDMPTLEGEIERGRMRLRALLEALEVQNIDDAMNLQPEALAEIGKMITKSAKLGAHMVPVHEIFDPPSNI